ncbi:MAG: membrane protein insertion efficiency factor YidD [Treponema sp.]|nr:membrane protein insertion efficiency factor YidD [Treponema sp.]
MFINFRRINILFTIIFLFFNKLYAESQIIKSLELDYTQIEGNSISKGHISFTQTPFYFSVEESLPEKTFSSVSENSRNQDFNKSAELLTECNNFLSWFAEDYGLEGMGFIPQESFTRDEVLHTKYIRPQDKNKLSAELIFSDDLKVKEIIIYKGEKELLLKNEILDFNFYQGFFYPKKIKRTFYIDEKTTLQNTLELTNIKLKRSLPSHKAFSNIKAPEKENLSLSGNALSIPAVSAQSLYLIYKAFITDQDASSCRYEPSCSQFMLAAIKENGIFGIIQGIERLERCTKHEHSRGLYQTSPDGHHLDPLPSKN